MRKYNGETIDITVTAAKLENKCSYLLPVHALIECETISYPYGKGKVSVVNLMYGGKATESLNDLRNRIFGNTKEPTNKNVPPTTTYQTS